MPPIPDLQALAKLSVGYGAGRHAVRAPFTAEVIGNVHYASAQETKMAVKCAREVQMAWAKTSMKERRRLFLRLHDRVLSEREPIMDLIQWEGGKARIHAYEEVLDVGLTARYYAIHAQNILKPRLRPGALPIFTRTRVYHHPLGVVGIIAPWNYPLALAISDAIPAMMAGNCVVLKPSEWTPFSALNVLRILREVGLPEGVFQVAVGDGREVGAALVEEADFVQFTGSTATGKLVAQAAGGRLARSSLELGGKNASIVLDDAPLERTIAGVTRSIISNGGQLCISIERLYVQDGIYDRFVNRLVENIGAVRLGTGFDFSHDVGSLLSQAQLDKVSGHVEDARCKGAKILVGGKARPDLGPYFYEPTLLEGVTPEMRVYAEETFGPVVAIYRFKEVDQAIHLANDSTYGLTADLWSSNITRAWQLGRRIQAGMVNINESYPAAWGSITSPMGGMKQSGIGRRHGPEGLLKYTESQTVAAQYVLPLFFIPGFSRRLLADLLVYYLKVVKHIPFLR